MTTRRRKSADKGTDKPIAAAAPEPRTEAPVPPAPPSEAVGASSFEVVPFNPRLAEDAREQWMLADWQALSRMSPSALRSHPEGARLLAISAGAAFQTGDRRIARERVFAALETGCDRRFLAAALLAATHNTLGRAFVAARRDETARNHFEQAVLDRRMPSEARRMAQLRLDQTKADLRRRVELAAAKRRAGMPVRADGAVPWMSELATRCMAADDFHEAVRQALRGLLTQASERVRFLMVLADQLHAGGDKMTALHYLNEAAREASKIDQSLRVELAKRFVAAGQPAIAMDLLVDQALESVQDAGQSVTLRDAVKAAYAKARSAEQSKAEHGHELLLSHLRVYLPLLKEAVRDRPLQMIEIGTTRENVPGQGSTRKLAEFCKEHGVHFTTVDMDPHNSQGAEEIFREMGVAFSAVAAKGEDFLRDRSQPVDVLFLDAYDFDHGKHSELRQSRYEKYLGARIDEQACHEMHLDCARSAVRLLSRAGVVCVDDTWLEDGAWTAKGTLAVPFLLDNGFELIEARNHAALLKRSRQAG
jgi:hypothetical protein